MSSPVELPSSLRGARVALVHDWLVTWRGGEKVLAAIAELFPGAPIYTLFHDAPAMPPDLERHEVTASLLDRIPGARERHRFLLPLMPAAIRAMRVPRDVDLVISSSHCVAKAIPVPKGAKHVSYVHAPLRYMWDRFDDYFGKGKAPAPVRVAARALRPAFRAWDVYTSTGVDRFLANSRHVAQQVADRYHRHAKVVHPPVELERFAAGAPGKGGGGYFLCLGALAPYKRIDVAVEAFRRLNLPLWIGGAGQSRQWLHDLPPNVKALGHVPDDQLVELYRGARALVFPGVEDFGITPLEAQASGRPVIAFAQGGAMETVTSKTGVFFAEQSPDSLVDAVRNFVSRFEPTFSPAAARENASKFTRAAFQQAIAGELAKVL